MLENLYAMIENTTLCGANCIMCPRDKFSHKFENMPFGTFKKIVDELVEGGCRKIGICGFGDSLCDAGLEKKLEYVKTICPDMYISTINTGHLLTPKNIDLVSKYFDIVKISMYGFTKETYESVHRGSLKFEQVKENIDAFLERNKGGEGVYTIMTFLVMRENEHEMNLWKDYYEPRCNRMDIWKPHNWTGSMGEAQTPVTHICSRVMTGNDLQFCTDGTVVPCCFDFDRRNNIGNVNEMTIKEILSGEELKRLQKIHKNGEVPGADIICRYCDQIRDRTDALVYSSEKDMKVGKSSMINYEK